MMGAQFIRPEGGKNLIWKNYYLLANLELSRVRINDVARTVYTEVYILWPSLT